MGLSGVTFLQSFGLVLLALSWFQHNVLNLLAYGWLPLVNLFLFLFVFDDCVLARRPLSRLYQLVPICCSWCFCSPILYRKAAARWLDG